MKRDSKPQRAAPPVDPSCGLTPHVVPTGAGESAVQLSATKLAARAKDLETLIGVVVDAAAVGASLWLSYIFVLFYLALALGGVTHRELL